MNRFRVTLGVGLVVSFVTICLTASFSDLPPGANELSDIIRPPRLCTSTSELPSNNKPVYEPYYYYEEIEEESSEKEDSGSNEEGEGEAPPDEESSQ